MNLLQQYERHGLKTPLILRPTWKSILSVLLFGPLFVFGSVIAIREGSPVESIIGYVGLVLFGPMFPWLGWIFIRRWKSGVLVLSNNGVSLEQSGIELRWEDVVTAWVTKVSGAKSVQVLVRNASTYASSRAARMSRSLDRLFESRRARTSLFIALRALGVVAGQDADVSGLKKSIARFYREKDGEVDVTVFSNGQLMHPGLTSEGLAEIIVAEAKKQLET